MKELTIYDCAKYYLSAGIITQFKHGYIFHTAESDIDLALAKETMIRGLKV